MKCIRCGAVFVDSHPPTTHEPIYCSDACENGDMEGLSEFLDRLRLLRGLDLDEVPFVANWHAFRTNPYEYLMSCQDDEAKHIWGGAKREGRMSGYAFRAKRVCADCRRDFIAFIVIAATAGVVWWRREQTRCEDCREGDK